MLSDTNSEKETTSITDTADHKSVNTPHTIDTPQKKLSPHSKQHKFSPYNPYGQNGQNTQNKKSKYGKHNYLLIKNLPINTTKGSLEKRYGEEEGFQEVLMNQGSNNVYIRFKEAKRILELIKIHEENPENKQIKMCLVNKLPLDLNERSRILLLTLYNEKTEITIDGMHELFKEYGEIAKMVIFKKKNYQIFLEFKNADDAFFFKQALHNQNFKNRFFLKIQFTQKTSLVVRNNNKYERDFERKKEKECFLPRSIDFPASANAKSDYMVNHVLYNNVVSSFNTLDNHSVNTNSFYGGSKAEKTSKKQLFALKAKNLNGEVRHKTLFNLFSLYGTIEKIAIDGTEATGYVYFHSEFDQVTAYHYLNGIGLMGSVLFLELLRPADNPNTPDNPANTVFYARNKVITPLDLQNKQKTINKPSNILYVFNLSKSATLPMLTEIFQNFEKVEKIYFLNHSRNSALCFFENIEAAVRILCNFKNVNVVDKSLKINFANEGLVRANEKEKLKMKFASLQSFDCFGGFGRRGGDEMGSVKEKSSKFKFFQGKEFRMF